MTEVRIISKVCAYCKHLKGYRKCKAYDHIPDAIWNGEDDHREPHPGDGGTQFESRNK